MCSLRNTLIEAESFFAELSLLHNQAFFTRVYTHDHFFTRLERKQAVSRHLGGHIDEELVVCSLSSSGRPVDESSFSLDQFRHLFWYHNRLRKEFSEPQFGSTKVY